jgi:hypothetical protein
VCVVGPTAVGMHPRERLGWKHLISTPSKTAGL